MENKRPLQMWIRWSDGSVTHDEYSDWSVTDQVHQSGLNPLWLWVTRSVNRLSDRWRLVACKLLKLFDNAGSVISPHLKMGIPAALIPFLGWFRLNKKREIDNGRF